MRNRKKTWKAFGLSLGLSVVMLSATDANAQYNGNRGMLGRGESADASPSRGLMDHRGSSGYSITNQTYGQNEGVPLGNGLLIMAAAGACYARMKRNKRQTKKAKK